jgi:hypothetical protein
MLGSAAPTLRPQAPATSPLLSAALTSAFQCPAAACPASTPFHRQSCTRSRICPATMATPSRRRSPPTTCFRSPARLCGRLFSEGAGALAGVAAAWDRLVEEVLYSATAGALVWSPPAACSCSCPAVKHPPLRPETVNLRIRSCARVRARAAVQLRHGTAQQGRCGGGCWGRSDSG